jgi:uncharacterized protein YjbI with pentapeptide repeats
VWAQLANTDFRNARLNGARFVFSSMRSADFSGQNLSNLTFRHVDLDFADLGGASLAGGGLTRSSLRFAQLDTAILANANLEGATFQSVTLAGRDLRGSLLRGVAVEVSDWSAIDASGVDASLSFWTTTLSNANFQDGNLEGAKLAGVNIEGANLRNAKLHGADLKGANFKNADFTGADLSFADVTGANLSGATGFNPDQPGMQFGNGVILPDGTTRAGVNSGIGAAPTTVPARLRFDINDAGAVSTRELTFGPNGYSELGREGGNYFYSSRVNWGLWLCRGMAFPLLPATFTRSSLRPLPPEYCLRVHQATAAAYISLGTFTAP